MVSVYWPHKIQLFFLLQTHPSFRILSSGFCWYFEWQTQFAFLHADIFYKVLHFIKINKAIDNENMLLTQRMYLNHRFLTGLIMWWNSLFLTHSWTLAETPAKYIDIYQLGKGNCLFLYIFWTSMITPTLSGLESLCV